MSRSSAVRGASVLALVVVLSGGGHADAASGQPWVVTQKSVSFNQSGRADCSDGVAIGGGLKSAAGSRAYLTRSEPYPRTGTPTGWAGRVSNRRTDGNVVDEYGQVFVVCATGVTATTRRQHFDGGGGQVSCAAGETALSGGVGVDRPSSTFVASTMPEPTNDGRIAWSAGVYARRDGVLGGTVYAVCAPGVTTVSRSRDLSDVVVSCESGEVATGGGVRSLVNGTYVYWTAPGYSESSLYGTERSWTGDASLSRYPGGYPGRGRVSVVCATPTGGSTSLVPLAPSPLIGTVISSYGWEFGDRSSRLTALTLSRVPAGARLEVFCREGSCPFVSVGATYPTARTAANALDIMGSASRRVFRAGTQVEVRITDAGKIGKAWTFAIRAGRKPLVSAGCIPRGSTEAQASC